MDEKKREQFDQREWYCRMLGHALPFKYCRTMQDGLPCRRILDCWYELLPIKEFVAANYTEEEQAAIFTPAKSRMDTVLETLNRVNKKK